ncbi:MAG: RS21-C6 protein [Candidatus Eremiobacteraeota bacterium]|nr:RS21-C6 protein [Candidatus Eremiobacteraeota bacterium]
MQYPEVPELPALQAYQAEVCRQRGWDQASDLEVFLLFAEEVGELAKAIRRRRSLFDQPGAAREDNVAEELADVFSYLLDLSQRLGVDLETAYRTKEDVNRAREWGSVGG